MTEGPALTPRQREVVFSLLERRKLKKVKWLVVSGGPGTGKSYLLRALRGMLETRGLPFVVLAPTNLAAANVEGVTIHKHIGGGKDLVDLISVMEEDAALTSLWRNNDIDHVTATVRAYIADYYGRGKQKGVLENSGAQCRDLTVIIDESSMVSLPLFYSLLSTFHSPETTRVVLFGDRFQLSPVSKVERSVYDLLDEQPSSSEIRKFTLSENVRQKENVHFRQFVVDWWNEGRTGAEVKHLRFGGPEEAFHKLPMPKIVLCGRRRDVHSENMALLEAIEGETYKIAATVTRFDGASDISSVVRQSCLPATLVLKRNIPVIMLKTVADNLCTNMICRFCDFVSVNGSTVAQIEDSRGQKHILAQYHDEIKRYDAKTRKMVAYASVVQYPIALFFSTTIHRVQGVTIDYPVLVKYSTFWDSDTRLAYVATSRVTKPDLLYYDKNPVTIPLTLQTYCSKQATVGAVIMQGIKRRLP